MTRFWITLDKVAQFVIDKCEDADGGEIFIPHMKHMNILDLANIIAPDA